MSPVTKTSRPIWVAFALTPLVTPLAFFLIYAAYFMTMGYNRPGISWNGTLLFIYIFGAPVGYVSIFVLGAPWIFLLKRWNRLNYGFVCLGSSFIGMIAYSVLVSLLNTGLNFTCGDMLQNVSIGLSVGLLSGIIFCAIAGVPIRIKTREQK